METNRIEEVLRDPSLEEPTLAYHEVRLPWQSLCVRPEVAARVLAAVQGIHRTDWVRVETVTGSVVFVRTEHVVFVREWTPAQRASERKFWDALDAEGGDEQEAEGEGASKDAVGTPEASGIEASGDSGWSREEVLGIAAIVTIVILVATVAASVTSWAWMARL